MLALLTSSSLKAYRRCPTLYRRRYVDRLRAAEDSDALRFGSLMHEALEAWWRGIMGGMRRDENLMAHALQSIEGRAVDEYEQARADVLMMGYHMRWLAAPLEPIAVEVEFRAPLINPDTGAPSRTFQLAGKLDVLCRDTMTGDIVIVEHKTSSEDTSTGSPYWAKLRMDSQISVYFDGATALGFAPTACIYDVIVKVKQDQLQATPVERRQYTKEKVDKKTGAIVEPSRLYANQRDTDETPTEYRERIAVAVGGDLDKHFTRGTIVRLEADMREHGRDVWQYAESIRRDRLRDRVPRNPDACTMFGRRCAFIEACEGSADARDGSRFFQVENAHSELSPVWPIAAQLEIESTPDLGTHERGVDNEHSINGSAP